MDLMSPLAPFPLLSFSLPAALPTLTCQLQQEREHIQMAFFYILCCGHIFTEAAMSIMMHEQQTDIFEAGH